MITNAAILSLGFFLYLIGLIIRNPDIEKVKVERLFSITINEKIAQTSRKFLQYCTLLAAFACIAYSFISTIWVSRNLYTYLIIGGILLVILKIASAFSHQISFFGIEIVTREGTNEISKKNIFSSTFLKGALFLIILGIFGYALDFYLCKRIKSHEREYVKTEVLKANRSDFRAKYINKTLVDIETNQLIDENDLVQVLCNSGDKNYYIKGRAGIGKSWFLRSLIAKLDSKCDKPIIFLEARSLDHSNSIEIQLASRIFPKMSKFALPIIQTEVSDAIFLIDGYDEIDFHNRSDIKNLITDLNSDHEEANILVTSRPLTREKFAADFMVLSIEPLDTSTISNNIGEWLKERLNSIISNTGSTITQPIIYTYNLRTKKDTIYLKDVSKQLLIDMYEDFTNYYELDIKSDPNQYALMSTFRDLDVLQDIFFSYLLQQSILNSGDLVLRKYGRTKIFELWIKTKIFESGKKYRDIGSDFHTLVFEQIYNLCLKQFKAKNGALSSFVFEEIDLRKKIGPHFLTEILASTDLFREDLNEKIFINHSLDEYFISLILKDSIDKDKSNMAAIVSSNDFYSTKEVLPFLVGQYIDMSEIMNTIINGMEAKTSIDSFYNIADFSIYTNHFYRSQENIDYLTNVSASTQNHVVRDVFSSYLQNADIPIN